MKKEEEYTEIFQAEALESHQELNRLLTELEKNPAEAREIDAIFRITHTLKGNAASMGFESIAALAHVVEDYFGLVRDQKIILQSDIFSTLFKAIDTLGSMIEGINEDKAVPYKGVRTKLEVLIRKVKEEAAAMLSATPKTSQKKNRVAKSSQDKKIKTTVQPEFEAMKAEAATATEDIPENKITFSDLVQVPVRKLDNLLNLVGELIIERDRMIASGNGQYAHNEFARLNRISSDLQYSVMDVRLIQVGFLFNKFHRVVRDITMLEDKQADLILEGIDTEIDRNILQIISDSLIHLIRNSSSTWD